MHQPNSNDPDVPTEIFTADPGSLNTEFSSSRYEEGTGVRANTKVAATLAPSRPQPKVLANQSSSTNPYSSSNKHSNRENQTLSPELYVKSIKAHSLRSITSSSFPGNNYIDLAKWLLQNSQTFLSPSTQPHFLAVLYELGGPGSERPNIFTQDQLDDLATVPRPSKDQGQILFVRGYLSPAWILAIGSKHGIDPEFLLRHLDFFANSVPRRLYSLPSLVSTTNNIIRLCVSTILYRDGHSRSQDSRQYMLSQRRNEVEELSAYKRQLRTQARCGDSLVREYCTLDGHYSIVEQWISICLTRNGDGWLGFVWMDQGRDLTLSPNGPWTRHLQRKASAFPVIQHHPKMTTRNTHNNSAGKIPDNANISKAQLLYTPSTPPLPQSGSLLPLEYDSLLALADLSKRCVSDPLAALAPVFAHAAFSEAQFLNLIETQVDVEVDALAPNTHQGSLEKLQYLFNILERHVSQLTHSLRAIEMLLDAYYHPNTVQPSLHRHQIERDSSVTIPSSKFDDRDSGYDLGGVIGSLISLSHGSFTPRGLVDDYSDLLTRSSKLCERCTTGIGIMMNRSIIQESRKAIEQTERVKKLTLLATFFIPLSFTASIFGMNFKIFGQGSLGIWWFFVLSVPITSAAYIFYLWDFQKWNKFREKSIKGS